MLDVTADLNKYSSLQGSQCWSANQESFYTRTRIAAALTPSHSQLLSLLLPVLFSPWQPTRTSPAVSLCHELKTTEATGSDTQTKATPSSPWCHQRNQILSRFLRLYVRTWHCCWQSHGKHQEKDVCPLLPKISSLLCFNCRYVHLGNATEYLAYWKCFMKVDEDHYNNFASGKRRQWSDLHVPRRELRGLSTQSCCIWAQSGGMYFLREALFKCKICVLIVKSVELLQDHHFSTLPDSFKCLLAGWCPGTQSTDWPQKLQSSVQEWKQGRCN